MTKPDLAAPPEGEGRTPEPSEESLDKVISKHVAAYFTDSEQLERDLRRLFRKAALRPTPASDEELRQAIHNWTHSAEPDAPDTPPEGGQHG